MVEMRELAAAVRVPGGADHVRVERMPSGRFTANGMAGGNRDAVVWTPAPFATLAEAVGAAEAWASEHRVATIDLRERTGMLGRA